MKLAYLIQKNITSSISDNWYDFINCQEFEKSD